MSTDTNHEETFFKGLPEEIESYRDQIARITEDQYIPPNKCGTGHHIVILIDLVPHCVRQALTLAEQRLQMRVMSLLDTKWRKAEAQLLRDYAFAFVRQVYGLSTTQPLYITSDWRVCLLGNPEGTASADLLAA